jgi:hypothetical protein
MPGLLPPDVCPPGMSCDLAQSHPAIAHHTAGDDVAD